MSLPWRGPLCRPWGPPGIGPVSPMSLGIPISVFRFPSPHPRSFCGPFWVPKPPMPIRKQGESRTFQAQDPLGSALFLALMATKFWGIKFGEIQPRAPVPPNSVGPLGPFVATLPWVYLEFPNPFLTVALPAIRGSSECLTQAIIVIIPGYCSKNSVKQAPR